MNKKTGSFMWNEDEEDYLRKNYQNTPNSSLVSVLKKSREAISIKAHQMGLRKDTDVIEYNRPRGKVKYRKETSLLADIICFYHRRGVKINVIAREVHCPPEQVEDILTRCLEDGMYEFYKNQENSAIRFEKDSPFYIHTEIRGSTRGKADTI